MASIDIEKLKQNNKELQDIINNSWDGIGIIDVSTKLIYINNAFIPLLGYEKNDLLKINFITLIQEKFKKDFLNILLNKDNKTHNSIDIACNRKDKKTVYLRITISKMNNKNLLVINTKDITKQIANDEILNDYVVSMHTDLHGHINEASQAFCNLSGYKKEELINKHFSIIGHEDTKNIIYENIQKSLLSTKEWHGTIKAKGKKNNTFWISMMIKSVYNKYGDITAYTILMFDITNEISLNDEASLLQDQVQNAQKEIKQKDSILMQQSKLAIMTETLQKLSHEWRQPLNIISMKAQNLGLDISMDNTPDSSSIVKTLDTITKEASSLSQTIESFQDFLHPKNEMITIDPKSIIVNAIKLFQSDTSNQNIDIIKDILGGFKFKTYDDELTTILVNLLINAKEAIVKNNIKNGVIKLKQYHVKDNIFFEVSDNGGGINEDIIHKIFEPYFSTKDIKHGVGLGLYTCKIIIEMHLKGIISVRTHSTGALFKISIPIIKT